MICPIYHVSWAAAGSAVRSMKSENWKEERINEDLPESQDDSTMEKKPASFLGDGESWWTLKTDRAYIHSHYPKADEQSSQPRDQSEYPDVTQLVKGAVISR